MMTGTEQRYEALRLAVRNALAMQVWLNMDALADEIAQEMAECCRQAPVVAERMSGRIRHVAALARAAVENMKI